MSMNTAHANNGVLLHAGERILLFCDNVTMSFSGLREPAFDGDKSGRLYLTTHRMVFNNKNQKDGMKSFSFPFVAIRNVELEQPVFGANYIKGKVLAQPNGGFEGEAKFKLRFKSGGAIDFGTAMLKAAQMASRNYVQDAPPPYTPPSGNWYAAPPPAYAGPAEGYGGWVPPTNVFPEQPPPNSVYMTDAPPPYPGINGYSASAPYAAPVGAGGFVIPVGAQGGATGGSNTNGADAKAAEAAGLQTGYVDPNNPQMAYLPQNDMPPSYDDSIKKNN